MGVGPWKPGQGGGHPAESKRSWASCFLVEHPRGGRGRETHASLRELPGAALCVSSEATGDTCSHSTSHSRAQEHTDPHPGGEENRACLPHPRGPPDLSSLLPRWTDASPGLPGLGGDPGTAGDAEVPSLRIGTAWGKGQNEEQAQDESPWKSYPERDSICTRRGW